MSVSTTTEPVATRDGRNRRAERTREAIADAMLSLIDEGKLRPSAPDIAERAGVALRTVFQHFSDMEALQATAVSRQTERVRVTITPIDASLPLAARISEFVRERMRIYEAISPVRRAALLSEPFSDVIRERMQATRRLAQEEAAAVFALELGLLGSQERAEVLAAITTCTSWVAWEELRAHQGLSAKQAAAVFRRMLSALLSQ